MHTILIVIHLLIVIALVGVVLVQRSEGGGLGIGGGSGFMTARGAANTLTRATAILAGLFFITSLALGILARYGAGPTSVLDRIPTQQQQQNSGGTLLDQLNNSVPNKAGNGADKAPAAQGTTTQPPASGQTNSGSQPPSGSEGAPKAAPATNGATATPPASGQGGGSGTGIPTGQ